MTQLKILDLNFIEIEVSSDKEVEGGGSISISSPTGSWAASSDSSHWSGYFADYYIDRSTGSVSYYVGTGYSAAVAGAVAGAVSDGSHYAFTYTSTGAY